MGWFYSAKIGNLLLLDADREEVVHEHAGPDAVEEEAHAVAANGGRRRLRQHLCFF